MPVVLVTGGAQGLGAAVCRQMAACGWTVAVADIDESGAQAVAGECGEPAFAIAVDLASAEGPAQMVETTLRRGGRLDVLVNCAWPRSKHSSRRAPWPGSRRCWSTCAPWRSRWPPRVG